MPTITSCLQLQHFLTTHNIDTSHWGTQNFKTITDLFHELQNGDIQLQSDPPLRVVRVVRVIVRQNDHILVEQEQLFRDGRTRVRNQPPSEKLQRDESPRDGARRCLVEELQVTPQQIEILNGAPLIQEQITDSHSYPGLQSHYILYTLQARVTGLPTDAFSTRNSATESGDPVVETHWHWQPDSTRDYEC